MQNAKLIEAQTEIKIARRISTTSDMQRISLLMAESKEELRGLLMRVKEENKKAGLKLNVKKTKIMASSPITSWQIDGRKSRICDKFYLLGLQNHCRW